MTTKESIAADGVAFLNLMRRYVINYTNAHDQAQTRFIMEPDYTLRMGEHLLRGRDAAYAAATAKQMQQFPGLGLTVHEIWTSGERLVMRFSEHGASIKHGAARSAWGGIGLYQWNGRHLTANSVEQDYFSRARQLKTGQPVAVESPAIAPWDTMPAAADPTAVTATWRWLQNGGVDHTSNVLRDDEWAGIPQLALVSQEELLINDLFSCGPVVAFHVTRKGFVLEEPGSPLSDHVGESAKLHMAGIVHLTGELISHGRVIRNRMDLVRSFDR